MKADRIRFLCQEIACQADTADQVALGRAILTMAHREKLSPAMLMSLYVRFGKGETSESKLPGKSEQPGRGKSEQSFSGKSEQPGESMPTGTIGRPSKQRPIKIEICMGKACRAKGASAILEHFQQMMVDHGSAKDGQKEYKIRTCSCLGRCGKAPVVIFDKNIHEKFKPDE